MRVKVKGKVIQGVSEKEKGLFVWAKEQSKRGSKGGQLVELKVILAQVMKHLSGSREERAKKM